MNYDALDNPKNLTDWVTFRTSAHTMASDEVSGKISETGVLKAFEMAIYVNFPDLVKKSLQKSPPPPSPRGVERRH